MGNGQRRSKRGTISAGIARWLLAVGALLLSGAVWAQTGSVGTLDHVAGSVFVQTTGSELRRAEKGTAVANGDTVTTDAGAYANIRFVDGAQVFLRPNARVLIEAYVFDKDRVERDSFVYRLLKGSLRAVTGQIGSRGKPEAYRLNTVVATIGIRGTTLDAELCAGDCPGKSDGLRTDAVDKSHGVSNPAGNAAIEPKDGSYTPNAQTAPQVLKGGNGLGNNDPPGTPSEQQQDQAIEKASQEGADRLAKGMEANRAQREEFIRKMEAQRDSNPMKDHAVDMYWSTAEDGRIEGGKVRYWKGGWITHEAVFDANGNTKGIEITPIGKSLQAAQSTVDRIHAEGEKVSTWSMLGHDIYGTPYIQEMRIYDEVGRRATMKFNENGTPYWSEYKDRDFKRVGGMYDPSNLPVLKDTKPALQTVQAERFATGACPACVQDEERHNGIAREMATLADEINNTVRRHQSEPGPAQPPLRLRHEYLMRQWNALKAEIEALRKKLAASPCSQPCRQASQQIARFGFMPVAVCAVDAASAAAADAVAKANNGALGNVTKLPSGRVEAELRVPTSADPKTAAGACDALKGLGNEVTKIETVPCGQMAPETRGGRATGPRARSVGRNPVEGKVEGGANFSQTTVIDRNHNADTQIQNFINQTTRQWGAGDARGPSATTPNSNGSFVIPGTVCAPRQPTLSESVKLGSFANADIDRVIAGVEYGQSGLSLIEKIIELKWKQEDGVPIKPEEVLGLAEQLNTLRGERFEKVGAVLEGITKNLERKENVEKALAQLQEVADFVDLASRGRDDPVVAAEALSKYLNLVGDIAGKVPGMGEFVQMYAQGVEGMLDNLRFIQQRNNLTASAIRDIENFTTEFYGDLNKAAPAATPSTPVPRPRTQAEIKADVDAQNRYNATRAEARALDNATMDLRSSERCIGNTQARMAAMINRGNELAAERQRLGDEKSLERRYLALLQNKAWYDGLIRNGNLAVTSKAYPRQVENARNISEADLRRARQDIERFREIGKRLDALRAELEKQAKLYEDCAKRLPGEQRAYLQALRAYVEKDTFIVEMLKDNPQAQKVAQEAAAKIPTEPPATPQTRVASPPAGGSCAPTTVNIVTVCEGTNFSLPGSGTQVMSAPRDETAAEWARRTQPRPIDFDKINEIPDDPVERERELREIDRQFGGR